MPAHKTHAVAVAAMLAAGVLVPRTAHGRLASAAEAPLAGATRAGTVAFESLADEATPKTPARVGPPAPAQEAATPPKENGFVRALTAPFRALARLFGGGGKGAAGSSKNREVKTAATKRADPRPASRAAENASGPEEGVKIIRPDEQALGPPAPSAWVPRIEGVGRDPLEQGRALLERGYLSEAVAELSVAAAGRGNLVEANNLLGLAYDRLGRHEQAAEAYERGLSASPRDAVLLTNLGYSLYLSNDFGGALKRLREAARLAPEHPLVNNHLGLVQARLGKYDDAFKSFARATGEYEAHIRLANLLEFVNRERQAAKHYEAALRLQPGATAVLERLLAIYERTGERTKADTARRTLGKPKNEQRTVTGGG
ncbi:MAG TPA: tetratricopeptide repeat protein [Pyrinomonadaceae bacterium]|nr:tetratricopeptide repeat protein [Pyrinomonadaceae bacterium]